MHTQHSDRVTTVHAGLVCTKPDWQVLEKATFLENKVLPGYVSSWVRPSAPDQHQTSLPTLQSPPTATSHWPLQYLMTVNNMVKSMCVCVYIYTRIRPP